MPSNPRLTDNTFILCSAHFRRTGPHRIFVVHTMNYVVADGRSNWMEGFILICMSLCLACTWCFQFSRRLMGIVSLLLDYRHLFLVLSRCVIVSRLEVCSLTIHSSFAGLSPKQVQPWQAGWILACLLDHFTDAVLLQLDLYLDSTFVICTQSPHISIRSSHSWSRYILYL